MIAIQNHRYEFEIRKKSPREGFKDSIFYKARDKKPRRMGVKERKNLFKKIF
jgi:hypothetical protein